MDSTYAVFGLTFGVRHEQQSGCLVVALLTSHVKRSEQSLQCGFSGIIQVSCDDDDEAKEVIDLL